jgi:hypothetical protein
MQPEVDLDLVLQFLTGKRRPGQGTSQCSTWSSASCEHLNVWLSQALCARTKHVPPSGPIDMQHRSPMLHPCFHTGALGFDDSAKLPKRQKTRVTVLKRAEIEEDAMDTAEARATINEEVQSACRV